MATRNYVNIQHILPKHADFDLNLIRLTDYPAYQNKYGFLPDKIRCVMDREEGMLTKTNFYDPDVQYDNVPFYPISMLTFIIHRLYQMGAEDDPEGELYKFRIKTPNGQYVKIEITNCPIDEFGCNFCVIILTNTKHPYMIKLMTDLNLSGPETVMSLEHSVYQFLFTPEVGDFLKYILDGKPV